MGRKQIITYVRVQRIAVEHELIGGTPVTREMAIGWATWGHQGRSPIDHMLDMPTQHSPKVVSEAWVPHASDPPFPDDVAAPMRHKLASAEALPRRRGRPPKKR